MEASSEGFLADSGAKGARLGGGVTGVRYYFSLTKTSAGLASQVVGGLGWWGLIWRGICGGGGVGRCGGGGVGRCGGGGVGRCGGGGVGGEVQSVRGGGGVGPAWCGAGFCVARHRGARGCGLLARLGVRGRVVSQGSQGSSPSMVFL